MVKRYIYLLISLFVIAFGVALITKASLGTSPIASVPYVLSLCTSMTMGQYMVAMNLLCLSVEALLMNKKQIQDMKYELMLQIPTGVLFGYFIDLSFPLLSWFIPLDYLYSIAGLILGCIIMATGIAMEVQANVAMMPADYVIRLLSARMNQEFGSIKLCFDVSLVVIACTISFIGTGHIEGVREGTVIGAIIVGPLVRLTHKYLRFMGNGLDDSSGHIMSETTQASYPRIITITREYGSGGREIGRELAKALRIPLYDKELIRIAAEESNLSSQFIESNEQSLGAKNLLDFIFSDYAVPIEKSLSPSDILFVTQSRIIRELAQRESCIILGRCSDYVLKDWPKESIIRVFCYTDIEDAMHRCKDVYQMKSDDIRSEIEHLNEARINHYQFYTGNQWGNPHRYDLMINTGSVGISHAVQTISVLYHIG
ncbi:MAG: cytidylate kinase family protein [Bacteroides sp.]|nr:cytidylate kinase family protein [Bacteroides sp.]